MHQRACAGGKHAFIRAQSCNALHADAGGAEPVDYGKEQCQIVNAERLASSVESMHGTAADHQE